MTRTLLITRSIGDGEELQEALHAQGHRVIHEPLTEIFLRHTARGELEQALSSDPDAVLVTSRYGARALASLSEWRDIPLVCVGSATAHVAESVGFTRISIAGGDVQSMIAYIADAYEADSRFVYVAAEHVRAELDQLLHGYGMQVTKLPLYAAAAAEQLSDTLIEQLKRNQIDGAIFLSQRSAQIFASLVEKADIIESPATMDAFCLSHAIADPLEALPWKSVHVSKEATLDSIIECVDNTYAKG
jgi:uroporphyrinogen-III synthase